jgi:hypothetical protein
VVQAEAVGLVAVDVRVRWESERNETLLTTINVRSGACPGLMQP